MINFIVIFIFKFKLHNYPSHCLIFIILPSSHKCTCTYHTLLDFNVYIYLYISMIIHYIICFTHCNVCLCININIKYIYIFLQLGLANYTCYEPQSHNQVTYKPQYKFILFKNKKKKLIIKKKK